MSLWLSGPKDEQLDEPKDAPTDADRLPRLMRSVVTMQFIKVACGAAHCMAITHDGRLYSWGWNGHGQCGLGDIGSIVKAPQAIGRLFGRTVGAVACGAAHTVALVDAPEVEGAGGCVVYAWGAHHAGQLGHGPKSKVYEFDSPGEVMELQGVAGRLSRDGEIGILRGSSSSSGGGGDGGDGDGHSGGGGPSVISQPLGCGLGHTALVASDGALWTWGMNQHGQCGQLQKSEEGNGALLPGQVCARGGVGWPGREALFSFFSSGILDWISLALAGACWRLLTLCERMCIFSSRQVHALVAHGSIAGVACGSCHTLVVTHTGAVFSFGLNATGQLGDGTDHNRPNPTPLPVRLPPTMAVTWVACGEEFSAAVTAEGALFMWGFGACGQLGLGNLGSMRVPRQATCEPLEQISCGGGHVVARTTTEGCLVWGYPGTWEQLKSFHKATGSGGGVTNVAQDEQQVPTGGSGFAARVQQTHAALGTAPLLLPLALDLSPDAYAGAMSAAVAAAPLSCRGVAAGRHCTVLLGEPVQPMPENEAALMIQCTFRRDRAQKTVSTKRKQEDAAAVIGGRASDYLARKALMSAQTQKANAERELAATKMQAHQRRRMHAKQAEDQRLAQQPKVKQEVAWATGKNVEPGKKSRAESLLAPPKGNVVTHKPTPPSKPKRTGGGFARKR